MRLLAVLLLSACSGLGGEPQIVATIPPATPIAADVALGAQIFAANCTSCHGAAGKGDGELVRSGQVISPGDFTDPSKAADQRPIDWYTTITNGKMESLMPPWGGVLTDAERWSVALYTYTLPYSQDQIARGQAIFESSCADCDLTSLTSPDAVANLSRAALQSAVAALPGFADLTPDEIADAAAYVRALSVANADAIGSAPPAQATVEPSSTLEPTADVAVSTGTISGTISNGTATGTVPADLPLTLFIFDADFNQQQVEGAASNGAFAFADVPLDPAYTYAVTTNYRDRVFASDIINGDALAADLADDGALAIPLTIYELTEDPAVIEIAGLVTQVSVVGESLEVAQVFNVTNTGDRAFTTSQNADDGSAISLVIALPPGSVIAGFPDNQNRYVVAAENSVFYDTVPVIPGEQHLVQVIYLIPYTDGAIIDQPLTYALSGPVRLLVRPANVAVASDQFERRDPVTIGSTEYQSYGADLVLNAGEVLRYELSGAGINPATQGDRSAPVVSSDNLLLVIVGAVVIVAVFGIILFVIASRGRGADPQVVDILVRQIAELDAAHDAGEIDDAAYESQRAALKARLAALMEKEK